MVRHLNVPMQKSARVSGQASAAEPAEEFYCERQSGGLCRMHSINAYLGGPKYTRASFEAEMAEFNDARRTMYGDLPPAEIYDITTGDQKNVIAFILAKHGVFARMYSFCQTHLAMAKMDEYGVAFVYSPDHVWIVKKSSSGQWFKIDSIGGITHYDRGELTRDSRLGIIVPTTRLMYEFSQIGQELEALVMPDIVDYLLAAFQNKKVIGEAETLIGSAVTILEIQNNKREAPRPLSELFTWYNKFIDKFHGKNCASLHYILSHVPQIIARIIAIRRSLCKLRCD